MDYSGAGDKEENDLIVPTNSLLSIDKNDSAIETEFFANVRYYYRKQSRSPSLCHIPWRRTIRS